MPEAPHGVLVVDKPSGPSSHDVVRDARRWLRTREVGHAGTLDPMASGVLVLGVGEGTKLLHHLSGEDKAYLASIRLGIATDTLDAQGREVERQPVPTGLSHETVSRALEAFRGEHTQRAPVISAIKQAGRPLYERVRRGEDVVAPERRVLVHALELLRVEADAIELRVHCGKGFYVRSLARDLALALGTVGHLAQLRRIASGAFSLEDAIAWPPARGSEATLVAPAAALRRQPRLTLEPQGVTEVFHGRAVRAEHVRERALPAPGTEPIALVDDEGILRALGRAEADRVAVLRGLRYT